MNQTDARHFICFQSPLARKTAAIGIVLSSLAALGCVPGWHRMFGFSGFSGLIGVAFIIESGVRFRNARRARQ